MAAWAGRADSPVPSAIVGGLLLLVNLGAGDFSFEQKKRI